MRLRVTEPKGSTLVPIAPGLVAPSRQLASVSEVNGYDVQLVVVVVPVADGRAGRFECVSVTVERREGGPAVTTEALRGIPVASLVKQVGASSVLVVSHVSEHELAADDKSLTDEMVQRFKQSGPTDEVLWWVAYVYRLALAIGSPPTKLVAEWMELPRSTAGRWVAAARDRGFLGAAEGPGKAGG